MQKPMGPRAQVRRVANFKRQKEMRTAHLETFPPPLVTRLRETMGDLFGARRIIREDVALTNTAAAGEPLIRLATSDT